MGRYTKVWSLPMGRKPANDGWQERQPKKEKTVSISQTIKWFIFWGSIVFLVFITKGDPNVPIPRVQNKTVSPEEPTEDFYEFNLEEFQKYKNTVIQEAYEEQRKLAENSTLQYYKNRILNLDSVLDIPTELQDKLRPDPSRFSGVEKFLKDSKFNGTIVEDFFYLTAPWFTQLDTGEVGIHFYTNLLEVLKSMHVEGCHFFDGCHHYEARMGDDGDVYLYEWLNGRTWTWKITRVYYVPSEEFMEIAELYN